MISNPVGTYTFFRRETKRFLKVYLQTIFAPVFSNLLYFLIFGISLYKAVPDVNGITYLQFLVPGLVAMGIINNAFQNPSSSLIIMRYQGLLDDLLTVPLGRFELLLGFVTSAVLRGFIVGAVTYLTAIFFVDLNYTSILAIFAGAFFMALFFAFLGVIVGIWAKDFDRTAFIQNFILTPLVFLGGVFYSIGRLPELAQTVSQFNPIVYMIDLLRYGFTGLHEYSLLLSYSVVGLTTFALGLTSYFILRSGWRLEQ